MTKESPSRRKFVVLGVSAGVTTLAGCSGGSSDGSDTNSGGGGDGSVVLEVEDQSGDGSSLHVQRASAPVEFSIDVHGDATSGSQGPFESGSEQTNVEVPLDPPLESDATLDVGLHNETNGQHVGDNVQIEYSVSSI